MSKLVLSLLKADLFGHTGASAKMPFCNRDASDVIKMHDKIEVRVGGTGRVAFVFYGDNNRIFTFPGVNQVGFVNIKDTGNLVLTYLKNFNGYDVVLHTGNTDKVLCKVSNTKIKSMFDKVGVDELHKNFIHYVNSIMDDKLDVKIHLKPFKHSELNNLVKSLPAFCNKPRSLNTPFMIGDVKLFSGNNLINHLNNTSTYKWHTTMCGLIYKDIVIMWDIRNYNGVFYPNKPITEKHISDIIKNFNIMESVLKRIDNIIGNNLHM